MQADRILADGRRGITKHSEMTDYLSPSQVARRMSHEVYPASGIPDPHLVSGLFKRVHALDRKQGPRDGFTSCAMGHPFVKDEDMVGFENGCHICKTLKENKKRKELEAEGEAV